MSYPSQNRLPYGMAVQQIPGMPGMTGVAVPGMPGMTPVQVAGISRVPNGMSTMYQSEKSAGLYPGANPSYQSLAQQGYLAQSGSLGQPGAAYYGTSSQHPTYLPVTSPSAQQRYMVSAGYPSAGSLVSSPSMVPSATAGYPLTAGAGYSLSAQQSTLAQPVPVAATTLSSAAQSQYPTYLGSQLTPLQISPSQNPYAASATGHPLYPETGTARYNQTMQNDAGEFVDMYVPRKCSASNRIVAAKDHASIQVNFADVDERTGRMTGTYKTYAICGAIRRMGESDDCLIRLAKRDGIIAKNF